jgi:hypothetical protein
VLPAAQQLDDQDEPGAGDHRVQRDQQERLLPAEVHRHPDRRGGQREQRQEPRPAQAEPRPEDQPGDGQHDPDGGQRRMVRQGAGDPVDVGQVERQGDRADGHRQQPDEALEPVLAQKQDGQPGRRDHREQGLDHRSGPLGMIRPPVFW